MSFVLPEKGRGGPLVVGSTGQYEKYCDKASKLGEWDCGLSCLLCCFYVLLVSASILLNAQAVVKGTVASHP